MSEMKSLYRWGFILILLILVIILIAFLIKESGLLKNISGSKIPTSNGPVPTERPKPGVGTL